jgi:penicillin amidase
MVVELGDKIDAWGIYPGGQSGNPGSYFYDNQVEDWAQGKYYPLHLFDRPDQKEFTTKWTIKTKP